MRHAALERPNLPPLHYVLFLPRRGTYVRAVDLERSSFTTTAECSEACAIPEPEAQAVGVRVIRALGEPVELRRSAAMNRGNAAQPAVAPQFKRRPTPSDPTPTPTRSGGRPTALQRAALAQARDNLKFVVWFASAAGVSVGWVTGAPAQWAARCQRLAAGLQAMRAPA